MVYKNWLLCPCIHLPESLHGQRKGQHQIRHVLSLLPATEHKHEQVAAQKGTAAFCQMEYVCVCVYSVYL